MKKISIALFAVLLIAGCQGTARSGEENVRTLTYFFSPDCHRCAAARANIMPLIESRFKGRVRVEYKDISDIENYKILFALKESSRADTKSVFPVLCFGGRFIDGRDVTNLTYSSIAAFIESSPEESAGPCPPAAGEAEIMKYFREIKPLAVMGAGFIDGINPCAFTVIVFFISFLFFHNYKKKNIALVGAAFIISVFITYVLIGLGLFGWLHAMRNFWFITTAVNITIALFSITLGILSLYDAIVFARHQDSGKMLLQLPQFLKNRIHSVIGKQYRVTGDKPARMSSFALFASALGVGFLVSIFESVCTGQLYLPTIMYVFKTTPYKVHAFGYLIIYNIMFTVPLFAIYLLGMAGVTSERFSAALRKHMFLIKIFMALVFFFLGASLLYADTPEAAQSVNELAEAGQKDDPNFYDFGRVKEGDRIKHTFMLKNNCSKTFNIVEVNTSCACTSSKIGSRTLTPGQEVPVELEFDTTGYPGVKNRQIFIHTDSKENPLVMFEIRADVQKKR